jgi:succinate--hydroxymethylglutarate CoA-transferase
MSLPLAGLRVIAVEQYGAGPFGTQYLADMGAEVIKIENPGDGGDVSRGVGPHFVEGVDPSISSLFFHGLNAGKKSVVLDLSQPEGRAILHRLVASADALACNLRGDVPEKLGLTYESLKAHNPKLVCVHLTAYGRDGPRRAWPGYDYLAQAEAGYFAVTGEPGAPPARMGLSIVDFMAGQSLALALVSGVVRARATGEGGDADVSLYDTALYNLNYLATWYLNTGATQGRHPRSAHPSLTPCQLFPTSDGWLYVMCNKEKFFGALCAALGRDDLPADGRFRTFADRLAHRQALSDILDEEFRRRPTSEWVERLSGRVPAAPILDVAQSLDAELAAGRIESLDIGGAEIRRLAPPIRWSDGPRPPAPSPRLGQHTGEVLRAVGLSAEEIEALKARSIVAGPDGADHPPDLAAI